MSASASLEVPKLLLVLTQPPLAGITTKEGLDVALAQGSFGGSVGLLFMGAGVLHLQPQQQPQLVQAKNLTKVLDAAPLYGIEQIYIEAQALQAYQLNLASLVPGSLTTSAVACNPEQLKLLFAYAQQALIF